jgi:hypothetical protein
MSQYSLPNFFPPVDNSFHFSPEVRVGRKPVQVSALSVFGGMRVSEEQKDSKGEDDQQRQDEMSAFSDTRLDQMDEEEDDIEKVLIFVKEPKIDSVLLIQSLTENNNHHDNPTPPAKTSSPRKTRLRRRNSIDNSDTATGATTVVRRSAEDALQFELSISSNGRNYTAVRSLPTIQRLRQELLHEVGHKEGDPDSPCKIKIPELPDWKEEHHGTGSNGGIGGVGKGGVARRSFSFLHSCLRSYVPALEGWLRAVTAVVPTDSPTLARFLVEPLWMQLEKELSEKETSCSTLDAIVESDTDEEESEEE